MKELDDLIEKIKNNPIDKIIREAVRLNRGVIVELNKEQLRKGIDSNGADIASYQPYSKMTATIKAAKGLSPSIVTLKDEGDFYKRFRVYANKSGYRISSTDKKTKDLKLKYGDAIFGLTRENKQIFFKQYILPKILKIYGRQSS